MPLVTEIRIRVGTYGGCLDVFRCRMRKAIPDGESKAGAKEHILVTASRYGMVATPTPHLHCPSRLPPLETCGKGLGYIH